MNPCRKNTIGKRVLKRFYGKNALADSSTLRTDSSFASIGRPARTATVALAHCRPLIDNARRKPMPPATRMAPRRKPTKTALWPSSPSTMVGSRVPLQRPSNRVLAAFSGHDWAVAQDQSGRVSGVVCS